MSEVRVNHLGLCVADLDRATAFYVAVFGFEVERDLTLPDDPSATLLAIEPPLGLRARYLRLDGQFVLELLSFADAGVEIGPPRTMRTVGLTHVSLSVDDIAATCARVREHGGTVDDATDITHAIYVRDPDGQLIELLPMGYWERTERPRRTRDA